MERRECLMQLIGMVVCLLDPQGDRPITPAVDLTLWTIYYQLTFPNQSSSQSVVSIRYDYCDEEAKPLIHNAYDMNYVTPNK